jgi:hypothetical protein
MTTFSHRLAVQLPSNWTPQQAVAVHEALDAPLTTL